MRLRKEQGYHGIDQGAAKDDAEGDSPVGSVYSSRLGNMLGIR